MSKKPKIYGNCKAGCLWETVHKDDFDKIAPFVEIAYFYPETGSAEVEPNGKYRVYSLFHVEGEERFFNARVFLKNLDGSVVIELDQIEYNSFTGYFDIQIFDIKTAVDPSSADYIHTIRYAVDNEMRTVEKTTTHLFNFEYLRIETDVQILKVNVNEINITADSCIEGEVVDGNLVQYNEESGKLVDSGKKVEDFVEKSTEGSVVYGTDNNGNQVSYELMTVADDDKQILISDIDGRYQVNDPIGELHVVNKRYVDGEIAKLPTHLQNGEGTFSVQQETEQITIQNTNPDDDESYEPEILANLNTISGYENVTELEIGKATGDYGSYAGGYRTLAQGNASAAFGIGNITIGGRSFAANTKNIVSANNSAAFGLLNMVTKQCSFTSGQNNKSAGDYSATFGMDNQTLNGCSFVTGRGNKTAGPHQTVVGSYNNPVKNTNFIVGTGTGPENLKNGLVVYTDGHVEIGKTGDTDISVATRAHVNARVNNLNTELKSYVADNYSTAVSLIGGNGTRSIKVKRGDTLADGTESFAFGQAINITGQGSAYFGKGYKSGDEYTAGIVSGNYSFGSGSCNNISGDNSAAIGLSLIASGDNQTVVGKSNKTDSNALFIVGNGTNERSNAFTVNVDGTATVQTAPVDDMDVANKKYVDNAVASAGGGSKMYRTFYMQKEVTDNGANFFAVLDFAVDVPEEYKDDPLGYVYRTTYAESQDAEYSMFVTVPATGYYEDISTNTIHRVTRITIGGSNTIEAIYYLANGTETAMVCFASMGSGSGATKQIEL